jgi:hypothetical protein
MGWSVPFSLGEFLVEGPLLTRSATDLLLRAGPPLETTAQVVSMGRVAFTCWRVTVVYSTLRPTKIRLSLILYGRIVAASKRGRSAIFGFALRLRGVGSLMRADGT